MNESGERQSPRRWLGVFLVATAAGSLAWSDALPSSASAPWRGPVCVLLAAGFGLFHALLSPATLSYGLMLDLRHRGKAWLPDRRSHRRLLLLRERARWIDLTLPLVLSLLWFAGVWLVMAAGAGWLVVPAAQELAVAVAALLWPALVVGGAWWCKRRDDRFAAWTDPLIAGAVRLLQPGLTPVVRLAEWLLVHPDLDRRTEFVPEQDLADVIEVGSQAGELTIGQSELLRRELDFARKTAADVMVPRVSVEYLDVRMTVEEARLTVVHSRFSRFPVQAGSVDQVVAILHAKQLLPLAGDAETTLGDLLGRARPPLHVRFDQPLEDVLEQLRRAKASLAVVDDAYGGVAGILTVEDVVEEIVGEIVDESDAEPVRETFVCTGGRQLKELAEHGIELPGEPDETVAEFLAARLDPPLRAGQVWAAGGGRLVVEATDVDGGIDRVRAEQDLRRREGGA